MKEKNVGLHLSKLMMIISISAIIGFFILFNQLGYNLYKIIKLNMPSWAWLHKIINLDTFSWTWEINRYIEPISYSWILGCLLIFVLFTHFFLNSNKHLQLSHFQGILSGFFFLPLLIVLIAIIGIVVWIVFYIFKLMAKITAFIVILVQWLVENIISPIIQFLSTPFMWLWDKFLQEVFHVLSIPFIWLWNNLFQGIIHFLSIPFVWLWNSILNPIFNFILKFLFTPLLIIIISFFCGGFIIFPFAFLGQVFVVSFRMALKAPFTPTGAFAHGIGLGFICFDVVLLYCLSLLGKISEFPSITILPTIAIPIIYFFRSVYKKQDWVKLKWESLAFSKKLLNYWAVAKLDLIATSVMIPVIAIGSIFLGGED